MDSNFLAAFALAVVVFVLIAVALSLPNVRQFLSLTSTTIGTTAKRQLTPRVRRTLIRLRRFLRPKRLALWFVGLIGFLSAVDTIWGPPWPSHPVVDLTGFDPSPLEHPFEISNPGIFFDVVITKFHCRIYNIKTATGGGIANIGVAGPPEEQLLPPKRILTHNCFVGMPTAILDRAEIEIDLTYHYRVWGMQTDRTWSSGRLTWLEGMWIRGDPLM